MKTATAVRRGRGATLALVLAAGSSAGAIALAGPALAQPVATASVGAWGLNYQAAAGQTNVVTIDRVLVASGKFLTLRIRIDDVVTIAPGAGCSPVIGDPTKVTCSVPGLIVVHADDRNDRVTVNAPISSLIYGDDGNDILAGGAAPVSGQNLIFGGAGDDHLTGGSGRDLLVGGLGADTFTGGAGVDTVSYTDHTASVRADPTSSNDDGSLSEHDTINADVENIWGGSGNDYLTGSDGPNELRGGGGNDYLNGLLGADVTDGGSGVDTVSYSGHVTAVTADLEPSTTDGSSGEGDKITTAENLTGGSGNDTLIGDNNTNTLSGSSGNDVLIGKGGYNHLSGGSGDDLLLGGINTDILDGGVGKDSIYGGAGYDTVSYATRFSGVTVRLDQSGYDDGNALDGVVGARDKIDASVENVDGGYGSDVIVGTAGSNELHGNAGIDFLYGGGGHDYIYGGTQYDYLFGQTGSDLCDVGDSSLSSPVEGISFDCESSQPPPK